jgi:hypothetical protein
MNIIKFISNPPQTPFAPTWEYTMAEELINGINWDEIKRITLEKEKYILQNFPPSNKESIDGYTNLGYFSLTSRYTRFNVFKWEEIEIKKLKLAVYKNYLEFLNRTNIPRSKVWIQCWANVMRDGQSIQKHIHSTNEWTYLSGHICVSCEHTSTIYINPINQIQKPEEYTSPNQIGKLTFFQSNIPHYTSTHNSHSERITFAFDLIVDGNRDYLHDDEHTILLFDNPEND